MAPTLEDRPNPPTYDPSLDQTHPDQPPQETRYGRPLPPSWVSLSDVPLRTPHRKLRIITIGAGVSAMGFSYQLYHAHALTSSISHTIYEANDDIGGTWLVNTYPGVACDVPAHVYSFPFEPNPDWSAYYASGAEILAYFRRTVRKYGLDRDVRTGCRVEEARWDEEGGRWKVKVRGKDGVFEDEADVLVSATGFLSHWRWPEIQGLRDFRGKLLHSADWDHAFGFEGKKVGVIGNGSSAIQIVPQLVGEVENLTNFVRNPTYITPGLGSGIIGGRVQHIYSEEEKRKFREDPEELKRHRKKIQHESNVNYQMFRKGSAAQNRAKKNTQKLMKERLGNDEELAQKLTPDWEVGCRRATPGPGYLEAFTRDNVRLVTEGIERIDETGLWTKDGEKHDFDVIICATGFDVSHRPPWPLIGRRGKTLGEEWAEEPLSYLSVMAGGFPNFFMFGGPNSPVGHGSLMAQLSWTADHICQWIRKMSEEDISSIEPKQECIEEFNAYGDEIMQTLVWSGGCRSWYKNHRVDGRVTAVWAGTAIGYHEMIRTLRPEDYNIKYRSRNRFRFMGNGRTKLEETPGSDLAYYITK
ncbi:flavin-binding monooxygenase-like protein 7 [Elsinoe australis]|uniref:Flavin-binding monooxygenase-like protein 7 n=1 Tax=Elsinoe australis TaxID=40998 RepID=A0A4U7APM9_9PEZI|nr:flavin-binding monooxygenase-like protein 7 [Elsinoe australis]